MSRFIVLSLEVHSHCDLGCYWIRNTSHHQEAEVRSFSNKWTFLPRLFSGPSPLGESLRGTSHHVVSVNISQRHGNNANILQYHKP